MADDGGKIDIFRRFDKIHREGVGNLMTLATDNFGLAENYQIDLPGRGFDNKMDVLHQFIKHFSFEKARILSVEIFEHPAHAVIMLTQRCHDLPARQAEKTLPTHVLKIWVSKQADKADDFQVKCDIHTLPDHSPDPKDQTFFRRAFMPWFS